MCGIAGAIHLPTESSKKYSPLLTSMIHRGPDGQGVFTDPLVFLGMRRLAIIDVAGGQQPIYNEDKSMVIIGNGEIYNYRELNQKLSRYKFRTGSDIETALHLYEKYGDRFVTYLRGMFALAIYDTRKQKLILARDRMGEKPLYYYQDQSQFIFASELKSIISYLPQRQINKTGLRDYLYYYYVPEPDTAILGLCKVPSAHVLQFDITTRKIQLSRYWSPQPHTKPGDLSRQIDWALNQAVELNLVADVPVALSLSGGLDSGAVLALASRKSPGNLTAFTVGYDQPGIYDETSVARSLANHFQVRHVTDKITTPEFVRDFPALVFAADDPVADLAAYPIFRVSRLARRHHAKVLLSGLGGDELFWGYPWVKSQLLSHLHSTEPWSLYSSTTPFSQMRQFAPWILTSNFRHQTGNPDFDMPGTVKNLAKFAFQAMSLLQSKWLVSNCLVLSDRLNMANSVESRAPLLDYPLVELACNTRHNLSDLEIPPKFWFKQAISRYLPAEFLNLPKKGFTPPVYHWLLALLHRYAYLFSDGFLVQTEIINIPAAKILSSSWRLAPPVWPVLYQLLVLEMWGRFYIFQQTPESV